MQNKASYLLNDKKIKKAYFILLIILLLPFIIQFFRKETLPNLVGVTLTKEKPKLTKESWFSGYYQEQMDEYNNDNWAWKEWMVRWNNQLYYNVFNVIRVNGFVSGLKNYVFSEGYIYSAYGDDLMQEDKIQTLLQKARVVQDSLKKYGKSMFLVFGPGKGMMCDEYIEPKYKHAVTKTNHQMFLEHSKKLSLNILDLYSWFKNLKSSSAYPLFTTFGHHWSYYAECLAVDTIIKYTENLHGRKIPHIQIKNIRVSDTAEHRDADVLPSMNLASNPKQYQMLAYPEFTFEPYSDTTPVKVLVVSDSYWYGPVYMGVPNYAFGGGYFWYYYNKVVPSPRPGEKVEVWELDLKEEIKNHDVLMIFYSDGNLPNFGNGVIEDLYDMFMHPREFEAKQKRKKEIQYFAKQIRESDVLMKKAIYRSKEENIPVDSTIIHMALEMLSKNQIP
ncbi:MAG: hypothetical protein N3F09_07490 [Bacteroidia bacterium]|nr:hypothetical protein [Bacteroidia bacterium]